MTPALPELMLVKSHAVRSPSEVAPTRTSMNAAGRKYACVNSSSRVHRTCTGRPHARARRAASIAASGRCLPPNPPPDVGDDHAHRVSGTPSASAIARRPLNGCCVAVHTVRRSSSHCASATRVSIGACAMYAAVVRLREPNRHGFEHRFDVTDVVFERTPQSSSSTRCVAQVCFERRVSPTRSKPAPIRRRWHRGRVGAVANSGAGYADEVFLLHDNDAGHSRRGRDVDGAQPPPAARAGAARVRATSRRDDVGREPFRAGDRGDQPPPRPVTDIGPLGRRREGRLARRDHHAQANPRRQLHTGGRGRDTHVGQCVRHRRGCRTSRCRTGTCRCRP